MYGGIASPQWLQHCPKEEDAVGAEAGLPQRAHLKCHQKASGGCCPVLPPLQRQQQDWRGQLFQGKAQDLFCHDVNIPPASYFSSYLWTLFYSLGQAHFCEPECQLQQVVCRKWCLQCGWDYDSVLRPPQLQAVHSWKTDQIRVQGEIFLLSYLSYIQNFRSTVLLEWSKDKTNKIFRHGVSALRMELASGMSHTAAATPW